MDHKFDSNVIWFTKQIRSRKRMLPNFAHAAALLMGRVDDNLNKFIDQHAIDKVYENDELTEYAIPAEFTGRHSLLKSSFQESIIFADLLPKMTLVSLVSVFDAYLIRLVKDFFTVSPKALNSSEKMLTFKQLSEFESLDHAREYLVDCEIESLLRDNHSKQFDWLEKKLKAPLRTDLPAWKEFIEITERRNLLVHSDGIVNKQYLDTCAKVDFPLDASVSVGSRLTLTPEYYDRACECIAEIGIKLNQVMWRKLSPGDADKADKSIIRISYDLLIQRDYHLAELILEFTTIPAFKCSSDESSLYLKVNHAIALKGQGKNDECESIINSVDWSALSDMFKLASHVLTDRFDEASEVMLRIGDSSRPTKTEYQDWPLFGWFRKSDQFLNAFKQVFGESFKVITHISSEEDSSDQANNSS